MNMWRILVMVLAVLWLTTGLSIAHKVSVFALAEAGRINGETYFSGGKPAKHSRILVLNSETEEELLSLQTDDQGRFSFPVPEAARNEEFGLKIVLLAGEAHRGEWLVEAEELLTPETSILKTEQEVERSPGPADILAGLGCILGVGTLIWFIRNRKRNN